LGGENACPPEDVGGIPGYYEFLGAMVERWAGRADGFSLHAGVVAKAHEHTRPANIVIKALVKLQKMLAIL